MILVGQDLLLQIFNYVIEKTMSNYNNLELVDLFISYYPASDDTSVLDKSFKTDGVNYLGEIDLPTTHSRIKSRRDPYPNTMDLWNWNEDIKFLSRGYSAASYIYKGMVHLFELKDDYYILVIKNPVDNSIVAVVKDQPIDRKHIDLDSFTRTIFFVNESILSDLTIDRNNYEQLTEKLPTSELYTYQNKNLVIN